MNCQNCGAPMKLGDQRTVLNCRYCLSTQKLKCESLDSDQVVPLGTPGGMSCPHCHDELVEAAVDGQRAKYCEHCHGVLVEAPIFAEVTWNRRKKYRGPELIPQLIDPEALSQVIECPQCQKPMEVHPHYGPGRAVIDSCDECHLVWLDHSELTTIERTPGRRS